MWNVKIEHEIHVKVDGEVEEVAASNNISTEQVAKLTGEKWVNRAASGEYVLGINGQWLKK
ncbi:YnbE family lipoprotein [Photorhabdus cinerea]|uniref:YnbE family lipoprotein n=1 Tax=Photorhabdus cinerea TaxID=471575 RepID=UPI0030D93AF8